MSFAPPKKSRPQGRLARQLAVFMALLGALLGLSQSANAMVCEADTSESALMTLVAEAEPQSPAYAQALAKLSAAPRPLHCDAANQDDCDMGLPEGQPQAPQPTTQLRPNAALGQSMGTLPELPGPTPVSFETRGQTLPGYASSLFRPPRSR